MIGAPARAIVRELPLPDHMKGRRAFAYPVPPDHLIPKFQTVKTLPIAIAVQEASGAVAITPLTVPTALLGTPQFDSWQSWSQRVGRSRKTTRDWLTATIDTHSLDYGWWRATTGRTDDPWLTPDCDTDNWVSTQAEEALDDILDASPEFAALSAEMRAMLPRWIGDRYLVARYLTPPDAQTRTRRQQAWRACAGPLLDALRCPGSGAGVLQAIDTATPLSKALCERVGLGPWAYRHLAALPLGLLAGSRVEYRAVRAKSPTEHAARGLGILGPALAPKSHGEQRYVIRLGYELVHLPPTLNRRLFVDLRRLIGQVGVEERWRAWLRLTNGTPFIETSIVRGLSSWWRDAGAQRVELERAGLRRVLAAAGLQLPRPFPGSDVARPQVRSWPGLLALPVAVALDDDSGMQSRPAEYMWEEIVSTQALQAAGAELENCLPSFIWRAMGTNTRVFVLRDGSGRVVSALRLSRTAGGHWRVTEHRGPANAPPPEHARRAQYQLVKLLPKESCA